MTEKDLKDYVHMMMRRKADVLHDIGRLKAELDHLNNLITIYRNEQGVDVEEHDEQWILASTREV